MSKLPSPRRKSPEKKNNNVQDIIPAAKRNFLTSTEKITKVSPLKRQASPEKLLAGVDEDGLILSPGSRSKIALAFGTPPKKEAKVWKSRWQVATLNGGVTEKGKKKKTNEATKLLDDEGVIQMLNRVPSVHGIMPKSASNSSGRAQRARSVVAVKPKNKQNKINVKRPESGETKKVTKLELQQTIRLEPSELATPPKSHPVNGDSKEEVKMEEFVSPKRAVRNISRDYSTQQELHENLSSIQSDDCFVYLTELPSEQLELLMNCDIRYSLPKQGAPVLRKPSNQVNKQKQSKDDKPNNDNLKTVIEPTASKPARCSPDQHKVVSSTSSEIMTTAALVKVKPVSVSMGGMLAVELPKQKQSPVLKLPPLPQPDQVENRLQDLLQHYKTDEAEMRDPNNLIPGQFNQIFVRFYETFAQITISTNKIKMKGSLNPSMIDEITHALNYTTEVKRLKGVIITGVGNIFCQGVDLNFLCNDNQDRRRNNAAQMAAAIERLVISLSNYPKLLVAAVNGVAVGLGVTILPLFDIVYANDKATFNTFFTRLGQIPEGAASVTLPQLCSGLGGPINEMLLLGRVLTASEMVGVGLVTQTFFPGRLMEELIPRMRRACGENNSGLQWNKLLLKQHQKSQVEQVITGETELLTDMWSSKDFHVNLVNFINTEKCLQFQNPN